MCIPVDRLTALFLSDTTCVKRGNRAIEINVILDSNAQVERFLWVSLAKLLVEHDDLGGEVRKRGGVYDFHDGASSDELRWNFSQ